MKASPDTVTQIAKDMATALATIGLDYECLVGQTGHRLDSNLWDLWHWIHAHKSYTSDHPLFAQRGRAFELDTTHELYPDDTDDNSMSTALRAAYGTLLAAQVNTA